MSLCTLAQVKAFMSLAAGDTDHDAFFNMWIPLVSDALAVEAGRICGSRPCLEKRTITELFTVSEPRTRVLWLSARPVVTVTEVKEAMFGAFTDADALVENEGYQLDPVPGGLWRIGVWLGGIRTVRAAYTGGYTRCDEWVSGGDYSVGDVVSYLHAVYECTEAVQGGTTAPSGDTDHWELQTGQVPLPGDITRAAIEQIAFEHGRRNKLGMTGAGVQGGSFTTYARDELLPVVRKTMAGYCRKLG